MALSPAWVETLRATLPELPDAKAGRFIREYGLTPRDASVLTAERPVGEWFEEAVAAYAGSPKEVANWVTGQLFALLKTEEGDITSLPVRPADLAALITLVDAGVINRNTGKKVLEEMIATGQAPATIVQTQGLGQVSDESNLSQIVEALLAANPDEVAKYREGRTSLLGWFMGQVMKETRGKANPDLVRALLTRRLEGE
jgi:aspartyl-tRNA(Asn)/glutamyl-tRNA(Gln) amidotransferase subunit B